MDLDLLKTFAERLRVDSIGNPEWVESKRVFEYPNQGVEVVTVLKLVRAAQGVHALNLLCRSGLFIDLGAIYRCVGDCVSEVYFLLENYPEQSNNVRKFIKEFYSKSIDGHLSSVEEPVATKKIHNAMIRSLTGSEQDEHTKKIVNNVYKTFSGYTHAGYSHIMQMYGGSYPNLNFNISGIPSQEQKDIHMQLVMEAYKSVLNAIAYVAHMLGNNRLYHAVMQCC
jgi:hypothetical protein